MIQDEGRFGRVNIPRNCWTSQQVRPLVAKQVVRESFYVYARICPKLDRISSLILPYANTEMMNLFLENVSDEYKEFEFIMQLDGAGWHKAKGLKIPSNIHFL